MSHRDRSTKPIMAFRTGITWSVVDRASLDPVPFILPPSAGEAGDSLLNRSRGTMGWQVPKTAHQVNVRSLKPVKATGVLRKRFATEVKALSAALARENKILLPGGCHPWLVPKEATWTWPLDRSEGHRTLHRLFDCQTHGWVNDCGTCMAISYRSMEDMARLHAAIRLLMPILPSLAASSPYLEGRWTGFLDARLEAALHAHERHPEVMGSYVPEAVFTQEDHDREILGPIAQMLGAQNAAGTLDADDLNARGAVIRFDEEVIELRVADTQECVGADLAIVEFVGVVLGALVGGRWVSSYLQRAWPETDLLAIHLQVIKDGGNSIIANRDYLLMFGQFGQDHMSAAKLWQHLFVELYGELSEEARYHIGYILEHGCLAARILAQAGKHPGREKLRAVYEHLSACLVEDRSFE